MRNVFLLAQHNYRDIFFIVIVLVVFIYYLNISASNFNIAKVILKPSIFLLFLINFNVFKNIWYDLRRHLSAQEVDKSLKYNRYELLLLLLLFSGLVFIFVDYFFATQIVVRSNYVKETIIFILAAIFYIGTNSENLLDNINIAKSFILANCIVFVIFIISSFSYSFFITYNASWIYGDDAFFLTNVVSGKPFHVLSEYLIANGRFVPLSRIDYNMFLSYGNNATVYYYWVNFKFIITILVLSSVLLFIAINSEKIKKMIKGFLFFIAVFIFLFAPATFFIYKDVIFIEANIILILLLFILFYLLSIRYDKIIFYIISLIFSTISIYLKEPVCSIFAVIALTNLFFNYSNITKKGRIFYFSLLINVMIFLFLYIILVYVNVSQFYNTGRSFGESGIELFIKILRNNPLFVILFLSICYRSYMVIFKQERQHLAYDAILFSSVAYMISFILLGIKSNYYFTPVYVLFAVSFYYFSMLYIQINKNFYKKAIILGSFLIMLITFNTSQENYNQIKWNQINRKRQKPHIDYLISQINNGYTLNFLFKKYSGNDRHLNTIQNWKLDVLNTFIDFYKNGRIKNEIYINKKYSVDSIDKSQILLVPDFIQFDERSIKKDTIECFPSTFNIIIYKHKSQVCY